MATRSLKGSVGIFEILKVIRKHKKVKKPCLSGSVMMGYICVTCIDEMSHTEVGEDHASFSPPFRRVFDQIF